MIPSDAQIDFESLAVFFDMLDKQLSLSRWATCHTGSSVNSRSKYSRLEMHFLAVGCQHSASTRSSLFDPPCERTFAMNSVRDEIGYLFSSISFISQQRSRLQPNFFFPSRFRVIHFLIFRLQSFILRKIALPKWRYHRMLKRQRAGAPSYVFEGGSAPSFRSHIWSPRSRCSDRTHILRLVLERK